MPIKVLLPLGTTPAPPPGVTLLAIYAGPPTGPSNNPMVRRVALNSDRGFTVETEAENKSFPPDHRRPDSGTLVLHPPARTTAAGSQGWKGGRIDPVCYETLTTDDGGTAYVWLKTPREEPARIVVSTAPGPSRQFIPFVLDLQAGQTV